MAFYGSTPQGQKVSRLEAIQNPNKRLSRPKVDSTLPEDNEQAVEAPTAVEMPEIDPAFGYLLELFYLSGQAMGTGMGLISITWQELDAFLRVNKLDLTLWEIETIKSMSDAYCSEYSRATDPKHLAPYQPEKEEDDEEQIDEEAEIRKAMAMRETLRSLRKR